MVMPRPTRTTQVLTHLQAHGRITDATARHQFGAFRLADVIYRLRGPKKHLLPKGKAIITVPRRDLNETVFAEYRLVEEAHAHA